MAVAKKRFRGARRSPSHKAFAAAPQPALPAQLVPDCWGVVPPQLSDWGNANGVDDCVCAEEAAAKAQYSWMKSGDTAELFIPAGQVALWSTQNGFQNGVSLTLVMEAMARSGMTAADGQVYGDGPSHSVDWTDDATLSSNIYQGPVKLYVASAQLNGKVSPGQNGWIVTGLQRDRGYDHCVNLCGFGPLQGLCGKLGAALPGGVDPAMQCYLMFTWGSIGIIDRASMIAITNEAWLRMPTTVLQSAAGPALATPASASAAAGPALAALAGVAAAPGKPENVENLRMLLTGIAGLLK
jgi:hypothetical protein